MILGLVERRHPLALEAVPAGSRRRGSRRRSRDGSGDGIRGAIHITGTESIERWFRDVTDSAANVSSIFAVASVGHSITVIQALARLLVITCSIGHPPHSSASPVELRLRVGPRAQFILHVSK